jgi:hypothetical protein
MSEKKSSERRKHARFKVKSGGLALVASEWPRSTVVGDILDISTGGVAMQYVGDEPELTSLQKIGIACSNPPLYLGQFPVKSVSNFSMTKIPFGAVVPKRLSLQFGELSHDQAIHLKKYIEDQALTTV